MIQNILLLCRALRTTSFPLRRDRDAAPAGPVGEPARESLTDCFNLGPRVKSRALPGSWRSLGLESAD